MKIRRNTNPSSPPLLPASHSPSLSGATAYSPILPPLNPQIPSQSSSILPPLMKDSEPPNSAGETSEAPPPLPAAAAMEKVDVLDAEKRIDGQAEAAAGPSSERATEGNEPPSEAGASAAAAGQPEEDGGEEKDGMAGENRDGVDEGSVAKEKEDGVAEGFVAKDKALVVLEGSSTAAPAAAGFGSKKKGTRTSCYHGVTRHKWTRKYEAHLYDRTVNLESRKRKGKQVYLGGYDSEEKAARAYDLGALKYWGVNAGTKLNFPISDYEKELVEMEKMNQDEWVASLRRRSSGFSRGVSVYRGVARRKDGKWQARVGTSVSKTKDIYLGAFNTEEEAAIAYDIAIVELRGRTAITNFDIGNYFDDDLRLEDLRREEATARLKL